MVNQNVRSIQFHTRKTAKVSTTNLIKRDNKWNRRVARLAAYKRKIHKDFRI